MAGKGRPIGNIIIIGVLSLIGAVFLAGLQNPRISPRTAPRNACINNLRELDGAAEQWRLENGFATSSCPAFEQIRGYLLRLPKCPKGGRYSFDTNSGLPKCSFPGHALP